MIVPAPAADRFDGAHFVPAEGEVQVAVKRDLIEPGHWVLIRAEVTLGLSVQDDLHLAQAGELLGKDFHPFAAKAEVAISLGICGDMDIVLIVAEAAVDPVVPAGGKSGGGVVKSFPQLGQRMGVEDDPIGVAFIQAVRAVLPVRTGVGHDDRRAAVRIVADKLWA